MRSRGKSNEQPSDVGRQAVDGKERPRIVDEQSKQDSHTVKTEGERQEQSEQSVQAKQRGERQKHTDREAKSYPLR